MSENIQTNRKSHGPTNEATSALVITKPNTQEAEAAVKTLLAYIGEDLGREGIKDTPSRVIKSYEELFFGYKVDIKQVLSKKFYDISDFNDIVLLKGIEFSSLCEHHMLPFTGFVDVAYVPNGYVVGVSKIARLVDAYAKRLQIQEKMTADIAGSLDKYLEPRGVAVRISATHSCMTSRGAMKGEAVLESSHFSGIFKENPQYRSEFWQMVNK